MLTMTIVLAVLVIALLTLAALAGAHHADLSALDVRLGELDVALDAPTMPEGRMAA